MALHSDDRDYEDVLVQNKTLSNNEVILDWIKNAWITLPHYVYDYGYLKLSPQTDKYLGSF